MPYSWPHYGVHGYRSRFVFPQPCKIQQLRICAGICLPPLLAQALGPCLPRKRASSQSCPGSVVPLHNRHAIVVSEASFLCLRSHLPIARPVRRNTYVVASHERLQSILASLLHSELSLQSSPSSPSSIPQTRTANSPDSQRRVQDLVSMCQHNMAVNTALASSSQTSSHSSICVKGDCPCECTGITTRSERLVARNKGRRASTGCSDPSTLEEWKTWSKVWDYRDHLRSMSAASEHSPPVYPEPVSDNARPLRWDHSSTPKEAEDYCAKEQEDRCEQAWRHWWHQNISSRFAGPAYQRSRPGCCEAMLQDKPVSNSTPRREDQFDICSLMVTSRDWKTLLLPLHGKLDTGADATVIQESDAKLLQWSALNAWIPGRGPRHLATVNGQGLPVMGEIRLNLKCCRTHYRMRVDACVVKNDDFPKINLLLSEKVIKRHHLLCDHLVCRKMVIRTLSSLWERCTANAFHRKTPCLDEGCATASP